MIHVLSIGRRKQVADVGLDAFSHNHSITNNKHTMGSRHVYLVGFFRATFGDVSVSLYISKPPRQQWFQRLCGGVKMVNEQALWLQCVVFRRGGRSLSQLCSLNLQASFTYKSILRSCLAFYHHYHCFDSSYR